MEDHQIIELYFVRSETAIAQTEKKYGRYCCKIAFNILQNREDSEECVNDTYLKAWNAMPPSRPGRLQIFLGKITRNLALDRFQWNRTAKRGRGTVNLSLEELQECIPAPGTPEQVIEQKELIGAINSFLEGLGKESRKMFLMRYWNMSSIQEIALSYGMTESGVKSALMRTRRKLKAYLEQEGISL